MLRYSDYISGKRLFESQNHKASADPHIKEFNRILQLNADRDADAHDIFKIPSDWLVYTDKVDVDSKDMMEPSQCFQNALDFSKKTGLPCVLGGFIDLRELSSSVNWVDRVETNLARTSFIFYPHAFNLNAKGEVYDVTINLDDTFKEWLYTGTIIDFRKYKNGFMQLIPLLDKMINRKK